LGKIDPFDVFVVVDLLVVVGNSLNMGQLFDGAVLSAVFGAVVCALVGTVVGAVVDTEIDLAVVRLVAEAIVVVSALYWLNKSIIANALIVFLGLNILTLFFTSYLVFQLIQSGNL